MPRPIASHNLFRGRCGVVKDRSCASMIGHLSATEVNGPRVERSNTKELKYSLELAQGFLDLSVSRQVGERELRFEQGARVLTVDPAQETHHLFQRGNFKIHVL